MARIKRQISDLPRPARIELVDRLVAELRKDRKSGQPVIDEREFASGKLLVNVIWDEWDHLPLEDRTSVILRAYELAEGREYRDRVALASGLTVPEAHAAGMLPFQILPALRRGDKVTAEQCRQAMIEEGASILLEADKPQLRFATEEDAEGARSRLVERLPESEPVWLISREVGAVENWAER